MGWVIFFMRVRACRLVVQRQRITLDKLTTSNQWVNNYGYDQRQSQGEEFKNLPSSYGTISAGLYWYRKDNDGDEKVFLGVAGFNLNQPEETFVTNDNFSSIRYNVQGVFWCIKPQTLLLCPRLCLLMHGVLRYGTLALSSAST